MSQQSRGKPTRHLVENLLLLAASCGELKSPRKSHYKKDEQALEAFKKTS